MKLHVLGIDLGKRVLHLVGLDSSGAYRNVWSAAELQEENEEWQLVCANVFGLQWSYRLRAMMDIRSLSSS
jgi:hypothetical protein